MSTKKLIHGVTCSPEAPGGCGASGQYEGNGAGTTAVRLPTATNPAEARGLEIELEEAIPALPRGRVDSTKEWRIQARGRGQSARNDPAGTEPVMVARLLFGRTR